MDSSNSRTIEDYSCVFCLFIYFISNIVFGLYILAYAFTTPYLPLVNKCHSLWLLCATSFLIGFFAGIKSMNSLYIATFIVTCLWVFVFLGYPVIFTNGDLSKPGSISFKFTLFLYVIAQNFLILSTAFIGRKVFREIRKKRKVY